MGWVVVAGSKVRGMLVLAVLACMVCAVPGAAVAKPRTGKQLTAKQRANVRAQLKREIRRNPSAIRRKSFLRRAALVNFVLPVTIRLRNPCGPSSALNTATCADGGTALNQSQSAKADINLGPSLGQRSVALGGSLAAEVRFNDSYDGGSLGNVDIKLLQSSTRFLKTSSVPLLWNPDMSDPGTRSDANFLAGTAFNTGLSSAGVRQGCGDFLSNAPANTSAAPPFYNSLLSGFTPAGSPFGTGSGLPGYPYYDPSNAGIPPTTGGLGTPEGYIPIYPGVDALDQLKNGAVVGNNDWLGPSQTPFPGPGAPGNFNQPPSVRDTLLRTNALDLTIASPGTYVDLADGSGSSEPSAAGLPVGSGSQTVTVGASGGQANLFGNIPGKGFGIDVTVNLATTINGIARIVDQDMFNYPLQSGDYYPAYVFSCHQVWLGAVRNYIPGVRLSGSLRIAPAITKDGKLRIAKATVSTSPSNPPRVALSACLFPASAYVEYNDDAPASYGFSDLTTVSKVPPSVSGIPNPISGPVNGGYPFASFGGLLPVNSDILPVFQDQEKYDPASPTYDDLGGNAPSDHACNTPAYELVRRSALAPLNPQTSASNIADGYTTTASGSQATVAGDIAVKDLAVDVLIGNVGDAP